MDDATPHPAAPKTRTTTAKAANKKKGSADASIQAISKSMNALGAMPTKAEMPLMLGMMKGMYDDWKQKVGEANQAEKDQKADLAKTLKDLDLKLKEHRLDQKDYNIIAKYRKREREIAHKQFHNVLKICHSGMAQFKNVIQAMEEAKAGKKLDAKTAQALGGTLASGEAPEVVLLQQVSRLESWSRHAKSALGEVVSAPN
jgi:hypothetical protein